MTAPLVPLLPPLWEISPGSAPGRVISELSLHPGQRRAWDSERRFVFMISGSQGGKTSFGPLWLEREIATRGPGDYLAVTATFPLLKLKMLPEFLRLFRDTLGLGVWSVSDKVFTFHDGRTRVVFGSADNAQSLESATAKAAWMDECVAPETLIDTEHGRLPIREIVRRSLPLRVWSYDTHAGRWELRSVVRRIRLPQREPFVTLGPLRLTGNHRVWTADAGYRSASDLLSACYTSKYAEPIRVLAVQALSEGPRRTRPEGLLQSRLLGPLAGSPTRLQRVGIGASEGVLQRSGAPAAGVGCSEGALCQSCQSTVGAEGWGEDEPSAFGASGALGTHQAGSALAPGRQRSLVQLATGTTRGGAWRGVDQRVRGDDRRWLASARLRDRRGGTSSEDRYRSRECGQQTEAGVVRAAWLDLSALLKPNGRDLAGGLSSDGCVYNLEVEGNHNYVANGILVANCGQDGFRLEAKEAVDRRLTLHLGRILGTTTPYNLGWLKTEVLDRWRAGDPDYDVIQFESVANPLFPRAEFERLRLAMPAWKFDMFFRGQLSRPAGLIYGDYLDTPRAEGGHLVHTFPLPPEWPRHLGVDFGGANTALVWVAHDPAANVYYLYDATLEGGLSTAEHVAGALAKSAGTNLRTAYGGAKSETQQRLDWQAAGLYLREPEVADVEAGIDRVIALLRGFRLYVFDTCRGVRDELGTYSRELDAQGQPTEKIKDKAAFHRLDALRYVAQGLSAPPIVASRQIEREPAFSRPSRTFWQRRV